LVLLIVAIVLISKGKLRMAFGPPASRRPGFPVHVAEGGQPRQRAAADSHLPALPQDRRAYVQGFALFISCYVGGSLILRLLLVDLFKVPDAVTTIVGLVVLVLAVASGLSWPLFRGQRWSEWKAATGFHVGRGIVREILSGWTGYFAGFPILILGMLVTMVLVKLTGADATHPIMKELGGGPVSWTMVFLLATVWAPITEELMFRGMLFVHLRERFGWWVSAPIVAFVFAAIHPQGWVALPVLGAIAIVLAGIREWRGSVIGCMAAHALHNGVAVIVATLMLT
jgi:membrane protease YdiL (CAAX protease family)